MLPTWLSYKAVKDSAKTFKHKRDFCVVLSLPILSFQNEAYKTFKRQTKATGFGKFSLRLCVYRRTCDTKRLKDVDGVIEACGLQAQKLDSTGITQGCASRALAAFEDSVGEREFKALSHYKFKSRLWDNVSLTPNFRAETSSFKSAGCVDNAFPLLAFVET
ncbi:unnamed protein product [Leuciscus chuanchicus]